MQFHNTLPAEFEQEHGSIVLGDDDKPLVEEEEDLELDLANAQQRIWLVKVPKFLMEKWTESPQDGSLLGRLRVYEEKDSFDQPKMAVILDEEPPTDPKPDIKREGKPLARPLPKEYRLTVQNMNSSNLFVFGEKEEDVRDDDDLADDDEGGGAGGKRKKRRLTKMLGKVHHECVLTPSLSSQDASSSYSGILRERLRAAAAPRRTTQTLNVDQATANRLASGMGLGGMNTKMSTFVKAKSSTTTEKATRMDRAPLLDLILARFEAAPYWGFKELNEHLNQPQVWLKEVLGDIGILVPRGPFQGHWTLKPEWKDKDRGVGSSAGGGDQKAQEDEDDDEEFEEVK